MAEKDKILEQTLKRRGPFDFKETYQFMYRWLTEEGYDVEEKKYEEKVAGESKDIEVNWVCEKKVSDYFKNEMKILIRVTGMKDVEVEKGGERVKMNQGTFTGKISGSLVKDWESTWEGNPLGKFLRGVYDKFVVEGRIKNYEGKIAGDVDELTEQIKAFLSITGMK